MKNKNFVQKYGEWALITGASAGIGKTFARELARKGLNLVLVARRQPLLDELAQELTKKYAIQTRILVADMSVAAEVENVITETEDLDIGLLVPNAGIEIHQHFDKQSWQQVDSLLKINVAAPTRLAHHFAGQMRQKGRGGILFVSSIMAFIPSAFFAQYSASKAYIQLLAEGMHKELKASGVDVTVLAPGLTDTDMGTNVTAEMKSSLKQPPMSTEDVVTEALNGLGRQASVIPGFINRMTTFMVNRLMPRSLGPAITAKLYKQS